MKKIIAIVTMLLAFTVSANAQNKKVSNIDAAKADVAALAAKIKMNETLKADLTTLMVTKHEAMSNPEVSEMEKANVAKGTERKLMTGLNEEQRKELLKYPELIKQLTH